MKLSSRRTVLGGVRGTPAPPAPPAPPPAAPAAEDEKEEKEDEEEEEEEAARADVAAGGEAEGGMLNRAGISSSAVSSSRASV
jgi:hypothetical protein